MRVHPLVPGAALLGLIFAQSACSGSDNGAAGGDDTGSQGSGGSASAGGPSADTGGSSTNGDAGSGSVGGAGTGNHAGSTGVSGATGAGGSTGTGGSGGGPVVIGPSKLPAPPGAGNVPKPAGAAANLQVLPWAGFKSAVTYTFDDSQPSQVAHWNDLKATGARVTFYLTTTNTWVPNYDVTWKDAASQGDELANHTVNHCNFNQKCNNSTLSPEQEIDQCTDYIKTKLGQPDVYTMAYPFGDAGYKTDAQSRFFLARGIGGGMVGPNDNTDPYNLPCVAAAGGETAAPFNTAIDTADTQGKWVIFLFHSLLPGDNWFAGLPIASVTDSIKHAQALPDVWVDSVANVGAYWLGQKLVTAGAAGGMSWSWKLPGHFPPGRYLRVTVEGGTLKQGATTLAWDPHGYYEVALDAGSLAWSP